MSKEIWVQQRKKYIDNINKFDIEGDRLQRTTQLSYMHNAIHETIMGLAGWFNGWISVELTKNIRIEDKNIATLSEKELNELHEKFKGLALTFIKMDIELTELITNKIKKKKKKTETTKDNSGKMVV